MEKPGTPLRGWRLKWALLRAAGGEMHELVRETIRMELRWLLPTLGVLLLLGLLFLAAGGAGPLAPFVYPLF